LQNTKKNKMAINPDKKTRKERRKDRAIAKESGTTLGLKCKGPSCAAPTSVKKQDSVTEQSRKDSSKFVDWDSRETQGKTTDVTNKPGMKVEHSVMESGKPTRTVDYVDDDPATNLAKVKEIGGSVTSAVSDPTASTTDETTKGGLKTKYFTKGLYKQTSSGDINAIKKYRTTSKESLDFGKEGEIKGKTMHLEELRKTGRGGNEKVFHRKSDDKSETRGLRKLARKSGTGTRYVSEDALKRKKKRMDKSISNPRRKVGHRPYDKENEKFLGGDTAY
jgi:hypothetical protein